MSGSKFNKVFAAILLAGIIAMLCGFVAKLFVQAEAPEKNAYEIEVTEVEAGGTAAPAGPDPILGLLAAADIAKGEGVAKACAACHDFTKGGPNRVGPNLYGIVGNHHAHSGSFAYSEAMAALKDKTWTYQELNEFLYAPAKHIKGTKMTFAGVKKTGDRADLIAWLRTLSDSPQPLPSAAEIAAEAPKEEAKAEEGAAAKTDSEKPVPAGSTVNEVKGETKADATKENPAASKAADRAQGSEVVEERDHSKKPATAAPGQ